MLKESPARIRQAKQAIAKAGVKIDGVYLTMGQYDLVAISEWPNEEAAAVFLLAQGAQGNVSSETLRSFTEDEFEEIVSKIT